MLFYPQVDEILLHIQIIKIIIIKTIGLIINFLYKFVDKIL